MHEDDQKKFLVEQILSTLNSNEVLVSSELNGEKDTILSVLKSLENRCIIKTETIIVSELNLTAEGHRVVEKGSPEFRFYEALKRSCPIDDEEALSIGKSICFKNKWTHIDEGKVTCSRDYVEDDTAEQLKLVSRGVEVASSIINNLRKRGLVKHEKNKVYKIFKGDMYVAQIVEQVSEITGNMLISRSYRGKVIKPYNFSSTGVVRTDGNLHPLLKVREEFRKIFIEMGFTEMATNQYIESCFWNFDALFQPQDHPSRDSHDTFYVKSLVSAVTDSKYLSRVSSVHSNGGYGSTGHRCIWKISEAIKSILRTHTTAISAKILSGNSQKGENLKFFSIDKVFRNESVDMTHLAEFHQVEGVIVGKNLTLGHLMGMLSKFFLKLGLKKLRYKPAFNPYTEPSMEIFAYHEGLGKYIEVGNSGIFRPEMLLPMGYQPEIKVFGWGLSLERPTMIKYGINNIRDLIGHRVSLESIENNIFVNYQ